MGREIKFRAWDETRKKYFSPEEMGRDQLTLSPDGRGFINVHGTDTRLSTYLNHLIPEQFIGLTDKNGKEIYEGDILKIYNETPCSDNPELADTVIDKVIFDNGAFCTSWYSNNIPIWDIEIIGNIHESPELLKGATDE